MKSKITVQNTDIDHSTKRDKIKNLQVQECKRDKLLIILNINSSILNYAINEIQDILEIKDDSFHADNLNLLKKKLDCDNEKQKLDKRHHS